MRWCHHCHHYNTNDVVRCRYCGKGVAGRLCPRNHLNPPHRKLAYCGQCGDALETPYGAGFSFRPYVLALTVLALAGALAGALIAHWEDFIPLVSLFAGPQGQASELVRFLTPVLVFLLGLLLMAAGGGLAHQILPPFGQKVMTTVSGVGFSLLGGTVRFLTRLVWRVTRGVIRSLLRGAFKGIRRGRR